MTPRTTRRALGWAAIVFVVAVGLVAAVFGEWHVVTGSLLLLVGANVAMAYDDRARSARLLKVVRAGLKEQQGLRTAIGLLGRNAASLDQALADARARDRRILGILESERQIAEVRSTDLVRAMQLLEQRIVGSDETTPNGVASAATPEGDPRGSSE